MNRINDTKPIRELAYKVREKILEKVFAYVNDDFIWSSQGEPMFPYTTIKLKLFSYNIEFIIQTS